MGEYVCMREEGVGVGDAREEGKVGCVREEEEEVWVSVRGEGKVGCMREEGKVWVHQGEGESGGECVREEVGA